MLPCFFATLQRDVLRGTLAQETTGRTYVSLSCRVEMSGEKTLMGGMELNKNTEGWWLLMVFHTLFFFWQSVYLIHVHIIFT